MDDLKGTMGKFAMNVLVVGKSDSIFIRDYCKNVLDSAGIRAVILSKEPSKEYHRDYEAIDVKEVVWPDCFLKGIRNCPGALFSLPRIWRKLRAEIGFREKIYVLQVHYVEPLHLIYFFPIWKEAKERILTFWGSDIYTISPINKLLLRYFLRHASSIIFMISNQHSFFQSLYGHRYDNKVKIIDFGNGLIDELDSVIHDYSKEECKKHFGLPSDKLIVHVGYNASRAQQHLEIIEGLLCLPEKVLSKMVFIFSMSYKREHDFEQYKDQLVSLMDKAKLKYQFFEQYLQGEELAIFRRTCDLFLYGQRTDARSESPLEYVYAGAEFVCPEWLADNYELLNKANIKYYLYNDFKNLHNSVQLCLENFNLPNEKISEWSRQKIRDEISWDSLAEKWRALYE